jgi:lysozyme
MQVSPRGVAFIAAHEGVVTHAYRDVAGVWTIGVGHTAAAGPPRPVAGMTISRDAAFDILARDLAKFELRVGRTLGNARTFPQHVFDGAVSFDFNTGAIHRASWVRSLKAGDIAGARRQLAAWNKAGGRVVRGLVRRREAEARLILDGAYGAIAPPDPDAHEVRKLQTNLRALGFHDGPVDGIAGPRTLAAVLAYQKTHPDLAADGIAGPATLASIARDLAALRQLAGGAGAAAGGLVAGVTGTLGGAGRPILLAVAVCALVVAAILVAAALANTTTRVSTRSEGETK